MYKQLDLHVQRRIFSILKISNRFSAKMSSIRVEMWRDYDVNNNLLIFGIQFHKDSRSIYFISQSSQERLATLLYNY